jgi:glycosyltransferase involved in cell wall biosynthesis
MDRPTDRSHARIAIDVIPLLGPLTGIGHYIRELVHHFSRVEPGYEYVYYYGYFSKRILKGSKLVHGVKDFLSKLPLLRSSLRGVRGTVAKYHSAEFDLYFEPNFIPLDIKAKRIVTTVHDFSFQLFPDAHPKDRVHYFANNFFRNIARSTHIITDSAYTKTEAVETLQLPANMITPIHLGVDHGVFKSYDKEALESCKRELVLPQKFILFVGTTGPRKNLDRLVSAYTDLPERVQREFSLVLVGPRAWGKDDPSARKKLGNRVVVLDYVETQKLALIYNLASAFVYPSLYEGFGLPPLEAMACGCPVVVSRAASLPEVCADAAYYIDPKDTQNIAEGMHKVLLDEELRHSFIEKGKERAKLFTWERTARETLAVFAEVLNAPG